MPSGDQLVLLDRGQFGPVKRLGLEQPCLERRAGLILVLTPLSRMLAHRPEGLRAEAHQRALLGIVNADSSARPASWHRTRTP